MCCSRFREDSIFLPCCILQAEDRVLSYIKAENRPFNVQLVADMMAQFGIKKPQVQRAVDALSEAGKITCKVRYDAGLVLTFMFHRGCFAHCRSLGSPKFTCHCKRM